jgi:hypothetical protein
MALSLVYIQACVSLGIYELSAHADLERQNDKISIEELEYVLLKSEILEIYPEDKRGESCLLLGYDLDGYPVHVVAGKTPKNHLRIITVYIPSPPKWINERTIDLFRNPQEQGLRVRKNRSLLDVNEIFEDECNAAIGGFGRGLRRDK